MGFFLYTYLVFIYSYTYPVMIPASCFRRLTVTRSPGELRSTHTFSTRAVPMIRTFHLINYTHINNISYTEKTSEILDNTAIWNFCFSINTVLTQATWYIFKYTSSEVKSLYIKTNEMFIYSCTTEYHLFFAKDIWPQITMLVMPCCNFFGESSIPSVSANR